ncbi:TrbG/VirB9 family P-type conjugative transfer protein (plasmid) [Robbsia andropogonis]|uniref:TrbG/VirB9 family P-type conjugative transfer protein n=1 Tax=Robbsia andropogonis TaxID=28092 RepID=UPI003D1CC0F2
MSHRTYYRVRVCVALLIASMLHGAYARESKPAAASVDSTSALVQALTDPMNATNPFNGGADATTLPNDARIAVFTYSRDQIFKLVTAPLKLTTIELATGEQLASPPAMGDSVRWDIDTDGANHIYIKPSKPGLVNTVHITTNKREYDFTVVSSPIGGFYYQVVRFNYPQSLMDKVRERNAGSDSAAHVGSGNPNAVNASPDQLNFDYTVEGSANFKPLTVFDDGHAIWLRMPSNAPFAVALVKEDGDWVTPNSITHGDYLIVQRLASEMVLRSGKEEIHVYRGKHRVLGLF